MHRCPTCDAELGYDTETHRVRTLAPTGTPGTFAIIGSATVRWRCLNAAWGCNWMLAAGTGDVWCRSCALTRGRPDEDRPDALAAWAVAEAAKRRVVHQLDVLGLPIVARSPDAPTGLTFDLVAVPDMLGLTGYLDGVVTLDLAEVDDHFRDDQRRSFGERHRSVIGHLRHEIGHHYAAQLVRGSADEERSRVVFGDERTDYRSALDAHYAGPDGPWDRARYVSRYATAHPVEDWAETFAIYLQILDVTATAVRHGLVADRDGRLAGDATSIDFELLVGGWRSLVVGIDDLLGATGGPPSAALGAHDLVVDKLAFVHDIVRRGVARQR